MAEKNLYIRCDEETYVKARELAQKNLRSLNRQVIHLINEAYDSVVKSEPAIAEPQPIQDVEDDKYIDGVLKSIQSRGWDIKNAISWKQFEAGMV